MDLPSRSHAQSFDSNCSAAESILLQDSVVHLEDSVVQREDSVVHLEDSVVQREDSVVHLEDSVVHLEDSVVHLEDSVVQREDSVVHLEDSVVHLEDSVVHREDSVVHLGSFVVAELLGPFEEQRAVMELQLQSDGLARRSVSHVKTQQRRPRLESPWGSSTCCRAELPNLIGATDRKLSFGEKFETPECGSDVHSIRIRSFFKIKYFSD
ncbi:hypothetical protein EYF80_053476 [Liparis tanakae]|uniref:Uncharacterized protein n=1 Tax=Liparis tanakae TaxID=230148 RepID=A0A4Z2F7S3_9TELE|nr:hypothetical protein EYF80_053476 [Liparis tanakae]